VRIGFLLLHEVRAMLFQILHKSIRFHKFFDSWTDFIQKRNGFGRFVADDADIGPVQR
jgi:hypothetical protein